MPDTWFTIPWHRSSGPFNMALDAALMQLPPKRPVVRVYGWHSGAAESDRTDARDGCITLGRFQRGLDPALLAVLRPFGLTRRATGGGAIFHHREVTYSIVGSLDGLRLHTGREAAYARYHQAWMHALANLGGLSRKLLFMPSQRGSADRNDGGDRLFCFTRRTGYDVLVDYAEAGMALPNAAAHELGAVASAYMPSDPPPQGKIIGSAQRHAGGVLLQHGSIKIDTSPLAPWEVSLFDLAASRRAAFVVGDAASGRQSEVDYERVSEALVASFAESLGIRLEPWAPSVEHLELARSLCEAKYDTEAWNANGRVIRAPSERA